MAQYGSIPSNESSDSESSPLVEAATTTTVSKDGKQSACLVLFKRVRFLLLGALVGVAVVFISSRSNHSSNSIVTGNANGKTGIRVQNYHSDSDEVQFPIQELSSISSSESSLYSSPVDDMGMLSIQRNYDALPSKVWGNHLEQKGHPLPTNSWYLNLVSHRAASQPDDQTRVYTVPYIIDTASPYEGMQGLRVHWPVVQASNTNAQMVNNYRNGLCLGAEGFGSDSDNDGQIYKVKDGRLSHLGVGLEWGDETNSMSTHIVRGMPYATMEYNQTTSSSSSQTTIPTIYSYNGLSSDVQIDRNTPFEPVTNKHPKLVCGIEGSTLHKGNTVAVQKHLHLHTISSDFTWIIFFNKPVTVKCTNPNGETDKNLRDFKLSVVQTEEDGIADNTNLVIRVALMDQCTTGQSTMTQHCQERNVQTDPEGYERLLKSKAHAVPNSPTIDFDYSSTTTSTTQSEDVAVAKIHIDWDATSTTQQNADDNLLMFGMPHHLESLSNSSSSTTTDFCVHSFHGNTCLVQNSKWTLEEPLGTPLSFLAPRPPKADLIPALAEYLEDDIFFQLPNNTLRGASDTYFSGKIVSRLARILVVAHELKSLAEASSVEDVQDNYYGDDSVTTKMLEDSIEAASQVDLPSEEDLRDALDQLKIAVTVWLKSDAEAPYIYDESWGGLVNCGCHYVGKQDHGYCNNTFPSCPALESVNEDFGNGYYNDHHYHYGYHVYAAAVAARLDPAWGRKHFDAVLIYIRDFANPNSNDDYFPQYRSKDWYLGSSWASGIVSAENSPHGRNEESSSEAISAYEGVTLFGSAMVDAFEEVVVIDDDDDDSVTDSSFLLASKLETAKLIRDSGQLLTASEIAATNRYWHIWSSDTHNSTYPSEYKQPVVGMLYDTMATFQTWFAPWAVVSYGIQLIPLTPVAETRDNVDWARELYPLYESACDTAGDFCEENGWSILQAGLLATTGNRTGAFEQAKAVPSDVFATDGGLGNSMSNTIWYIATRKEGNGDPSN